MDNLLVAIRENQWYKELALFRDDPRQYFVKKRVAENEFLLDILHVLFEDNVSEQCKLELLNALQESSTLFSSFDSVENTIGSLQNLYSQVMSDKHVASHGLLPAQILNTMVTVLLLHSEDLNSEPSYYDFYMQVFDLLWIQCSKINNTAKYLVRHAAIQSLIALERHIPGINASKLEDLRKCCSQEKTFLLQHYALLFSLTLKNSCNIEELHNICDLLKKMKKQDILSNDNATSLKKHLNYAADLFPAMSPVTVYNSLQNLIDVTMQLNDVSPLVFKPVYIRCMKTGDEVILASALYLFKKFVGLISSEAETQQLISQFLTLIKHPGLKVERRLLLLSWCLENINIVKQYISGQLHEYFICKGFDGAETQHLNHKLLAAVLTPGPQPDSISEIFISSLNSFRKRLRHGFQSKIAIATFQTLFCYYVQHNKTVIKPEIQKVILSLIADKSKLAQHVLDFIQAIKQFDPQSVLPCELLSAMVNNITKLKVKDIDSNDLQDHLLILEYACKQSLDSIQPFMIIDFLQKLLSETSIGCQGEWLFGNKILSVCRNILYYQNTDTVYENFGDLLRELMINPSSDIDVKDQAKLYYGLLTSISSTKRSSIMQAMIQSNEDSFYLDSLVSDTSGLRMGTPVLEVDTAVVVFKKLKPKKAVYKPEIIECNSNSFNSESAMLDAYQSNIKSPQFTSSLQINFSFEIAQDVGKNYENLFCVILKFDAPDSCGTIQDLEYPALLKKNGPIFGNISFTPKETIPSEVKVRAIFNLCNGQTCSCNLSNLQIDLEDFFRPLSVPPGVKNTSEWKFLVFKEMENMLLEKAKIGKDKSSQKCVIQLNITKEKLLDSVLASLSDCTIPSTSSSCHNAIIFVPPCGHLLLTFQPLVDQVTNSHSVLAQIATDSWQLLLHIQNTFNRFMS